MEPEVGFARSLQVLPTSIHRENVSRVEVRPTRCVSLHSPFPSFARARVSTLPLTLSRYLSLPLLPVYINTDLHMF